MQIKNEYDYKERLKYENEFEDFKNNINNLSKEEVKYILGEPEIYLGKKNKDTNNLLEIYIYSLDGKMIFNDDLSDEVDKNICINFKNGKVNNVELNSFDDLLLISENNSIFYN